MVVCEIDRDGMIEVFWVCDNFFRGDFCIEERVFIILEFLVIWFEEGFVFVDNLIEFVIIFFYLVLFSEWLLLRFNDDELVRDDGLDIIGKYIKVGFVSFCLGNDSCFGKMMLFIIKFILELCKLKDFLVMFVCDDEKVFFENEVFMKCDGKLFFFEVISLLVYVVFL